jgi:rhodanese-related sulfurtransferase
MGKQISKVRSAGLQIIIAAVLVLGCGIRNGSCETEKPDRFENIRSYIESWISSIDTEKLLISSNQLKESILDRWDGQKANYQIVSVRNPDDDKKAGHIPNAVSIYWVDILSDSSMSKLDANKTIILYCYYGHASMLSCTILNLLGYRCLSLDFGMMGWNLDALVKTPWDKEADYSVETAKDELKDSYALPVIKDNQSDAKSLIRKMASRYFAGEGSPVIVSSDVKAIIDNWDQKKAEYQIIDVRSDSAYNNGHIPHSINIPWADIAKIENLKKLDLNRISIVYSENGQLGQMVTTVLNLFGYRAVEIKFGMMDWNKSHVNKSEQWDAAAMYPVELE